MDIHYKNMIIESQYIVEMMKQISPQLELMKQISPQLELMRNYVISNLSTVNNPLLDEKYHLARLLDAENITKKSLRNLGNLDKVINETKRVMRDMEMNNVFSANNHIETISNTFQDNYSHYLEIIEEISNYENESESIDDEEVTDLYRKIYGVESETASDYFSVVIDRIKKYKDHPLIKYAISLFKHFLISYLISYVFLQIYRTIIIFRFKMIITIE